MDVPTPSLSQNSEGGFFKYGCLCVIAITSLVYKLRNNTFIANCVPIVNNACYSN